MIKEKETSAILTAIGMGLILLPTLALIIYQMCNLVFSFVQVIILIIIGMILRNGIKTLKHSKTKANQNNTSKKDEIPQLQNVNPKALSPFSKYDYKWSRIVSIAIFVVCLATSIPLLVTKVTKFNSPIYELHNAEIISVEDTSESEEYYDDDGTLVTKSSDSCIVTAQYEKDNEIKNIKFPINGINLKSSKNIQIYTLQDKFVATKYQVDGCLYFCIALLVYALIYIIQVFFVTLLTGQLFSTIFYIFSNLFIYVGLSAGFRELLLQSWTPVLTLLLMVSIIFVIYDLRISIKEKIKKENKS